MSKELLDFVERNAILDEPAGEGVPEAVEMKNPNRFWLGFDALNDMRVVI